MTRFGFIVHPLHISDVARKYAVTRLLPGSWVEALAAHMSPQYCGRISGVQSLTGAVTEGWLIGCPLTTRQLINGDPAVSIRKIVAACQVAADRGAEIVGLGAFTSIVGDKGLTIADQVDIGVTTGNSYTTATAIEGALLAAQRMGHDPGQSPATILGATGSIGRICARLLAPQVGHLTLVGRRREALEELAASLDERDRVAIGTDIGAALPEADIVLAVTSALQAVVEPEHLKPGAVVCDVARPRDVSRRVVEQRDDVLVIEGGVVAVPGPVQCDFDFGFPPGTAYACMCETMMLALEGRTGDHSLGEDLKEEQVREMASLARKHGFKLAGFRSFERQLSDEDIDRVRDRAARALAT